MRMQMSSLLYLYREVINRKSEACDLKKNSCSDREGILKSCPLILNSCIYHSIKKSVDRANHEPGRMTRYRHGRSPYNSKTI